MRIAVDVMGGDHAPAAAVRGAVDAVRAEDGVEVVLVGDSTQIKPLLAPGPHLPRIDIVDAREVITMDDAPVAAVKHKRNSSMVRMIQLVEQKEAAAGISAGNTGALMTAGLLTLGRMKGIERPALTAILPVLDGWGMLMLDVGANLSPKASQLVQYGVMGSLYCQEVYKIANPRVALLNVGEEAGKGPPLLREAHEGLQAAPLNFVGNVESRELLQGKADVVVCDGFSGNIALKLSEGLARDIMRQFRQVLMRNRRTKLAAWFLKAGLLDLRTKLDYQEYGGAPLLGLDQPIYKCHGASEARAFQIAVKMAHQFSILGTQSRIRERVLGEENKW